jgi:hypothetical protein
MIKDLCDFYIIKLWKNKLQNAKNVNISHKKMENLDKLLKNSKLTTNCIP